MRPRTIECDSALLAVIFCIGLFYAEMTHGHWPVAGFDALLAAAFAHISHGRMMIKV